MMVDPAVINSVGLGLDIAVINSVGLGLDIVGVLLLFKYGLPSDVGDHPDSPPALTVSGISRDEYRRRGQRWAGEWVGSGRKWTRFGRV